MAEIIPSYPGTCRLISKKGWICMNLVQARAIYLGAACTKAKIGTSSDNALKNLLLR